MKITAAGDRALLVDLGEVTARELHAAAAVMRETAGVVACIPGHSSLYVIFDGPARLAEMDGGQAPSLEEITFNPASSPLVDFLLPTRERGEKVPQADEGGPTSLPTAAPVTDTPSSGLRPPSPPLRGGEGGRRGGVGFDSVLHTVPVCFEGPDLAEFLSRVRLSSDVFLSRVRELRLVARYLGFRGGFAYLDGWPAEWAMPRRPTSRPVKRGSFGIAGNVAGFYPIDTPGGWNLLGRTAMHLENAIRAGDEILIDPVAEQEQPDELRVLRPAPSFHSIDIISAPLAVMVDAADYARLERGLPAGGPFDVEAAQRANRMVGNDPDHPLLECAFAGPRIRARQDVVIAWQNRILHLRAGEEVALGKIGDGLRAYLAVGIEEREVEPLQRADRLTVRARPGPHLFGIGEIVCAVTPQLDRVGIRLQPVEPLSLPIPADLRSAGMQCGTVQLHPDGSLVVMGPDHPVTGGYLQPMTVLTGERWKLALLAPGERVRLLTHWP